MVVNNKRTFIRALKYVHFLILLISGFVASPAWAAPQAECLNISKPQQGLYATAYKHAITLTQGDKTIELKEGEAGYGSSEGLSCLGKRPAFLEDDQVPWPAYFGVTGGASCGINQDYELLVEFDNFFKAGYPVTSALLYAIANGHTVDEAVYVAISAQPERAEEIYNNALSMMPYLPGWACGTTGNQVEYFLTYKVTDLPDPRTVAEVSKRYFKERKEMHPFPDWVGGDFHMLASTQELLELVSEGHWYKNGPAQKLPGSNPRDTIMVGLYDQGKRVIIDADRERLRKLLSLGVNKAPVVFYFNRENQRPVSDFKADATLEDVIQAFFGKGLQLSPPPLWQVGDYHLQVKISELEELFEIPSRAEIGEQALSKIMARLQQDGFQRSPILVTLLSDGKAKYLAESGRVRAAAELGMTQVPVVVFYHSLDRLPCGAPANCLERLCTAATCAGAGAAICQSGLLKATGISGLTPLGGGGGPPPPPPSPPPPPPPPPFAPPSPR